METPKRREAVEADSTAARYRLEKLRNGVETVWAAAYQEKMHPGVGPAAEAEHLHVRQLKIPERLIDHPGEFTVWDVGLGAAANAVTLLRLTRDLKVPLRLVSFDDTLDPLAFALEHADVLKFLRGYEAGARTLLNTSELRFVDGQRTVHWSVHVADFPSLVASPQASSLPKPQAIMFDAFSPATNPGMWTQPVFENLFRAFDPSQSCSLTTYSRSTLVRVSLLLAGFFVGRGRATGLKEETTVAANDLRLLDEPLDDRWLERAAKSSSAEPLNRNAYHRAPLSADNLIKLRNHPQFRQSAVTPAALVDGLRAGD